MEYFRVLGGPCLTTLVDVPETSGYPLHISSVPGLFLMESQVVRTGTCGNKSLLPNAPQWSATQRSPIVRGHERASVEYDRGPASRFRPLYAQSSRR
jgi:hypothetical protein